MMRPERVVRLPALCALSAGLAAATFTAPARQPEGEITDDHHRHIIGDWGRRLGQLELEFGEAGIDASGHGGFCPLLAGKSGASA